MLYLYPQGLFDPIIKFDPTSGTILETYPTKDLVRKQLHINGMYTWSGQLFLALYRFNNNLNFRFGDTVIEITDDTQVFLERFTDHHRLVIKRNETVLLDWSYETSGLWPSTFPISDPFESEEDYEFGVKVFNVVNDDERRYDAWS